MRVVGCPVTYSIQWTSDTVHNCIAYKVVLINDLEIFDSNHCELLNVTETCSDVCVIVVS